MYQKSDNKSTPVITIGGGKDFNRLRRRHVDQVFRNKNLSLIDKLTAYAIAYRVDKRTGCTFSHPTTLALDIGAKHTQVRDSIERLLEAGHHRKAQRGGVVDIFPLVMTNAEPPVMPGSSKDFQRACRAWLNTIMFDTSLTQAQRVSAFAIAALINPYTRECRASCVYRKPRPGRNGDEVHPE